MQNAKRLMAPFPLSRWNIITFAITWGVVVCSAHFILTPIVGIPAPAGFFVAMGVLILAWSVFIRRDEERSI